jgi:hypothetical protein
VAALRRTGSVEKRRLRSGAVAHDFTTEERRRGAQRTNEVKRERAARRREAKDEPLDLAEKLTHLQADKLLLIQAVRKRIYRSFMRFQGKVGTVKTFAVVIDKSRCATPGEVRETAWRHTLERVEAFARHNNETVMLFPDSGEYDRFRKLARQMRRFSQVGAMVGGGTLSRPLATFLIDDPVERDSAQSYFVQLADLNAYAAYRKERPDPLFPQRMWDELGPAILIEANQAPLNATERH